MKEKKDCKIIQDLLPNYIENLTNTETNIFIEEHLKECDDCKKISDNMKKEFKVNTTKRDGREVKYIKKYNKKMKTLKVILLITLAIYVLIVARRTIIMVSLCEKANESKIADNYYVKSYSYSKNILYIVEKYIKGEDYIKTYTSLVNGDEIDKTIYYKKGNEKLVLREANGNKFMVDPEIVTSEYMLPIIYVSEGLIPNMKTVLIDGIDKTYCNGKECYIIRENNCEKYIDKETGIAIREISETISKETDVIREDYYEFNIVKDSDIVRPDTTDYIKKY